MAKNVLSVAASENLRTELGGTSANNIDDIAGFSSRGLAADGRIKPDIAAPGTSVSGGRSGTGALDGNIDAHHRRSSGTSHAAPQIAGAAALFTQFWKNSNGGANPPPALVKAALINGAVEINGVGSTAVIPNGAEGWGRLNMKGMLNTGFPIQYVNQTTPLSNVGQNVPLSYTVADATKPLRVSLVWTDPPGVSDPALVNNLDLIVIVGGNTYKGNVFTGGTSATGGAADVRNNVENVFLPAGIAAGSPVTVRIGATALNGDGILGNADTTDQHFALVVSNANVGAPVASVASNGVGIVSESASPANNTPDPGETLTVGLTLQNYGGANTGANVTATLLATGGISNPSATQSYGTLTAGGASAARNFTFSVPAGAACGSTITLTFQVQDGANSFNVTQPYTLGALTATNSQNFDSVTAPALPTGWTSSLSNPPAVNAGTGWTTSTATPASASNASFAGDPATVGLSDLESPVWNVTTSAARLDFKINYNTESGFDGAVLEMKISAAGYQDIIAAGGSFVAGGYNRTLNTGFNNPLPGRAAWTGNSNGYVSSSVNLPAAANGQSVQFRWRMGSDNDTGGIGVRLDDVQLFGAFVCAAGPTAAAVSIGGRVLTTSGRGIAFARVTLTTENGMSRTATTNPFGYYRFDEVAAGETDVFTVAHKRYRFAPQAVSITEDLTTLNFTSETQ